MADYPTSIWTPPVRGTNMSDAVTHTDVHDEETAELVATQTEMGTSPSGAFSTVAFRLKPIGSLCQVRNGGQTITNNTLTALSHTTEDLDPLAWHDGGTPTLVTPNVAGWYRVTNSLLWGVDTDYTRTYVELQKNEAALSPAKEWDPSPRVTTGSPTTLAWPLISMNGTTDRFRVVVIQVNTSTNSNTCTSTLLVELVYPT